MHPEATASTVEHRILLYNYNMNDQSLHQREKRWLLEEKYQGVESEEYLEDLERLETGEPLDFLIGSREFLGCQIDLSKRPLIPRNETEYWVKDLLSTLGTPSTQYRVLDLCAGSGCIGIAILKHIPHAHVTFGEINPDFIEQIQLNLTLNKISPERYEVIQSDLFENIGYSKDPMFDVIVANPPYIAENRRETVQDSVHDYEDHDSLYSPEDGLYHLKEIIKNLSGYLSPTGECYIEYDPWQTPLIDNILKEDGSLSCDFLEDQYGKTRILVLHRKKAP